MNLTKKQYEILWYVANGLTAEETGRRVFLAKTTVKAHLGAVRRRIGARNTAHAVYLVFGSPTRVSE